MTAPAWFEERRQEERLREKNAAAADRIKKREESKDPQSSSNKGKPQDRSPKKLHIVPKKNHSTVRQWRSRWRVLKPSELPSTTRLVLWEISDHMDYSTGTEAYPNMETISTGTGLNMTTVRNHRDLAVKLGWLDTYKRMKRHGEGLAYRISFPTPDQQSRAAEIVTKSLQQRKKRKEKS